MDIWISTCPRQCYPKFGNFMCSHLDVYHTRRTDSIIYLILFFWLFYSICFQRKRLHRHHYYLPWIESVRALQGGFLTFTLFLLEVLNQLRNKTKQSADGSQNSTLVNLIKAMFEGLASFWGHLGLQMLNSRVKLTSRWDRPTPLSCPSIRARPLKLPSPESSSLPKGKAKEGLDYACPVCPFRSTSHIC